MLDSDEKRFGGFERLDQEVIYSTDADNQVSLYIPNRVVMVLSRNK
jgi:1,4-alpha-glucan branching enzyme